MSLPIRMLCIRLRWPDVILQWAGAVLWVEPDLSRKQPQGFSHFVSQIWAFDPAYVQLNASLVKTQRNRRSPLSCLGFRRSYWPDPMMCRYLIWPRARHDLSLLSAESRAVTADVCRYHSEIVRTALRVTWCCFQWGILNENAWNVATRTCLRLSLSTHTVLMYTVHNMCIFCMHTIGAIYSYHIWHTLFAKNIGCRRAAYDSMQLNLAFFQCNE